MADPGPGAARAPDRPRAADAATGRVPAPGPCSAGEAMAMVLSGLGWLAACDTADLPDTVLADCLRGLEAASSMHTAARAAILASFCAREVYTDDGQGSPRTWLRWQTQITGTAATDAITSMRRLAAHPSVAAALRAGQISASWSRQICRWTDLLPDEARDDADVILLAAADHGADLADLAALADQIRRRLARPDQDPDDGHDDRAVHLATTFRGAGHLTGDLTPRCAAAVHAVLNALAKRAGPEDTRTPAQRRHDALEEACRRLIASGCLPDHAGQPTQIQLHITLDDLLRARPPGTSPPAPADASPGPLAPTPPSAPAPAARPGDDCDATIIPIVTGRTDHELLHALARQILANGPQPSHGPEPPATPQPPPDPGPASRPAADQIALRDLILRHATALLSGPDRLTAWLRTTRLTGPAASISLPLDAGTATDTIPAHLRRAVIHRDRHCAAPGCDQPPAACQIHHITPRSHGGPTSLPNLLLLCTFHHLILIHQWGWSIRLNPDGTTTATSPHGRTIHSHDPPPTPAAA